MAKDRGPWYETAQGVLVLRRKTDDGAAQAIVDGMDNGWTLLSHNIVSEPRMLLLFVILGVLSNRAEHILTFAKRPYA